MEKGERLEQTRKLVHTLKQDALYALIILTKPPFRYRVQYLLRFA